MTILRFIKPVYEIRLILLTAVFIAATGNWPFFSRMALAYPLSWEYAPFLVSLAFVLVGLLAWQMSLLCVVLPARVVASLFILLAAPIGYVAGQFGTIVDTTMIQNIVETDSGEAYDLLSIGMLSRIVLLGVLPTALLWWLPAPAAGGVTRIRRSVLLFGGCSAAIVMCVVAFGAQYAGFFREHTTIRWYANPAFAVYSLGKYVADNMGSASDDGFESILPNAELHTNRERRELIVMVVGESARADRFTLNGYGRPTTPYLSREEGIVSYTNVRACGTSTAVSVPCIFLPQTQDRYDRGDVRHTENVLDVLSRLGVDVIWRDNNSGSKEVAERIPFEAFNTADSNPVCELECRDIGMLDGLQDYVDTREGDILIVFHQMGSHGPAYFKRYPPQFETFTPACQFADLEKCSAEEIGNAYDNTIVYTDYFLSQVVAFLKANTPQFETAMLYVGDHGESLGEKGVFLHGLPYFMAPDEQTRIPLIVWVGQTSDIDYRSAAARRDAAFTHDSIFNSLLLLFEIRDGLSDMPSNLFSLVGDDD